MVRIADRPPKHRHHRVAPHLGTLGQRREPFQAVAPYPVGLVGFTRGRGLPDQAGVAAEHEPLDLLRRETASSGRNRPWLGAAGELDHREHAIRTRRVRPTGRPTSKQPTDPVLLPWLARLIFPVRVRHRQAPGSRWAGQPTGLAPEPERLGRQRQHLGRGVALGRVVAGQRVDQHVEQRSTLVLRRPVLHLAGLLRSTGAHQLLHHWQQILAGDPRLQHPGRDKTDLGVHRGEGREQQIRRQSRAGQRHIARRDDGEHQVLHRAVRVLQPLEHAPHPVGAQRDEAQDGADADRPVLVLQRAGQHRDRPIVAQSGQPLGGPAPHRQVGVRHGVHQRLLLARTTGGGQTAGPHLAHVSILVVQQRHIERDGPGIPHVGQRARRAAPDLLAGPVDVRAGDGEQRLHRLHRPPIASLAAQLGRPHPQVVEDAVPGQDERLLVLGHQVVRGLDGGDVHHRMLVLDQLSQLQPHILDFAPAGRTLAARRTDLGPRRRERRQVHLLAPALGLPALLEPLGWIRQRLVRRQPDLARGIPHELDQQLRGPGGLLRLQLPHHPDPHVGVPRRHTALQRQPRVLAVPGPQRTKRLGPHLLRLVVQRVPQQRVGPFGQRRVAGVLSVTAELHQDLQRTHADVLVSAAQRQLRQLQLPHHTLGFLELLQRPHGPAANRGVLVVEQPLQARHHPVVTRHGDGRAGQRLHAVAAHLHILLPAELEQGPGGAGIAEQRQTARSSQRRLGGTAGHGREQRSEVFLGQLAARRTLTQTPLLLQLLQRLGRVRIDRRQPRRQGRPNTDGDEERRAPHRRLRIVQRGLEQSASLRLQRVGRTTEADQRGLTDVSRTPGQGDTHRRQPIRLHLVQPIQRLGPNVGRGVPQRIRHQRRDQGRDPTQTGQLLHRLPPHVGVLRRQRGLHRSQRGLPLDARQRRQRRRTDLGVVVIQRESERRATATTHAASHHLGGQQTDLRLSVAAQHLVQQHPRVVLGDLAQGPHGRFSQLLVLGRHILPQPGQLRVDAHHLFGGLRPLVERDQDQLPLLVDQRQRAAALLRLGAG